MIEYLNKYKDIAINQYHVDPVIFLVLYLLTVPTFYFGIFLIGKASIEFSKGIKKRESAKHIFSVGLTIVILSWLIPNLYVAFFGKNLPYFFWVAFILIFSIGGILTFLKIKKTLTQGRKGAH